MRYCHSFNKVHLEVRLSSSLHFLYLIYEFLNLCTRLTRKKSNYSTSSSSIPNRFHTILITIRD